MRLSVPKGRPAHGRSASWPSEAFEHCERLARDAPLLASAARTQAAAAHDADLPCGVRPDHHVLEHGQRRERARGSGTFGRCRVARSGGPASPAGRGRRSSTVPGAGLVEATHHVEQGGLAGAVRADRARRSAALRSEKVRPSSATTPPNRTSTSLTSSKDNSTNPLCLPRRRPTSGATLAAATPCGPVESGIGAGGSAAAVMNMGFSDS